MYLDRKALVVTIRALALVLAYRAAGVSPESEALKIRVVRRLGEEAPPLRS